MAEARWCAVCGACRMQSLRSDVCGRKGTLLGFGYMRISPQSTEPRNRLFRLAVGLARGSYRSSTCPSTELGCFFCTAVLGSQGVSGLFLAQKATVSLHSNRPCRSSPAPRSIGPSAVTPPGFTHSYTLYGHGPPNGLFFCTVALESQLVLPL